MKETKTKLKELGFTQGHAHLLLVAVAFFAVLTFVQSDLSLKALFANADDEVVMLTFDQVQSEVEAEYGGISTEADAVAEEQLALLDRSLDSGQVLGDVIGIGAIPDAEEWMGRENLDSIPVRTIATNPESVESYANSIGIIEANNDVITLVGELNNSDKASLANAKQTVQQVSIELLQLSVPSELLDYHRYKITYYQILGQMAEVFLGNSSDASFVETSKAFFSVINKIEQIKAELQTKYNAVL